MALGTIAAIGAGAQALLGVGQTVAGLTMPKPDIPDYEIPEEVYQNMTDAEYWSFMGLPDAQKQQFIDQIAQQGASALSASSSRKGGLGMVSSIAEQKRQGARDLLAMDSAARMQNIQNLWGARKDVAAQKVAKYQADTAKSMQLRQERKDMIGAGIQNIAGAFGSVASMASLGGFDDLKKGLPEVKTPNTFDDSGLPSPDSLFSGFGTRNNNSQGILSSSLNKNLPRGV